MSLFQNNEFLCLHPISGSQSIDVHAACQFACIELNGVVAGTDLAVNQGGDLLAEGVEHRQRNV